MYLGLSQIVKIIGEYILLCNYFALSRIESLLYSKNETRNLIG